MNIKELISTKGGGNIICDLSKKDAHLDLQDIIGAYKPDFIWASPVCTVFSRAAAIKGGNLYFEVKDGVLHFRENFDDVAAHKAYSNVAHLPEWQAKIRDKAQKGLRMMWNARNIIHLYNTSYGTTYALENPASAISKHLLTSNVKNTTAYCAYGFPYKKATNIYSNQQLNLKQCTHKNHDQVMSGWPTKTGIKGAPSSNKNRSAVPVDLIIEIIQKTRKGG